MSSVFSKNKEKRQRCSSNEGNTSFVKNVTQRVSGLLPATITKWFSSPSSSNANGSAQTADATDSSTEDEAPESPVVTQPPTKRMRYNTPNKYDHFVPTDANCTVSNIVTPEPSYSYTSQSPGARSTLKSPIRSPSEEVAKEKSDTDTTGFKIQHTVSNVGHSVERKRKSIFDTYGSEESKKACSKTSLNVIRDLKQPYFKPSLLGSPFYPGRTMYGGAASSYINQPNIKQQKVALVNKSLSKDDSGISASARRIMDLLEQYSSPLIEAKRIPHYTKPMNDSLHNTTERHSPYQNKNLSYKTQELYLMNVAPILRLKQKSRLMNTTSAARQIIASHSSGSEFPPYPSSSNGRETETDQRKMTTKIKTNVARTNRGNHNDVEVGTPIKLQAAGLPIDTDKLPKFSFGTPAVSLPATATSTPKTTWTENQKSTEVFSSKNETVTSNHFKFSNPVRITCDPSENKTTPPKYQFDSPERRIEQKLEQKKDNIFPVINSVKESGMPTQKSNDWKCSECWVSNKSDANKCVCCGAQQPSKSLEKVAKCTVCKLANSQALKDKCVNCEKMQVNHLPTLVSSAPKASESTKWKCEDCWVSNDDSAGKCACCGAAKPKKSGTAPQVQASTAPAVAGADTDWKCKDCWIQNKSTVDKCAACGGAKPGTKSTAAPTPTLGSSFFAPSNDSFKNIVKSQNTEKWECPSCLVKNDVNKSLCVCCGAEKDNKTKIPENKFNFGLSSAFKFGIDPQVQEATLAKQPEQGTALTKLKEQSEKNNNVLAETPTFTFTLPNKKPEEKADTSKAKLDEAPKPTFSFGIPKQDSAAPAATTQRSPVKSIQAEKEKPQEVPKVNFTSCVPEQPKPLGGVFSSPLTSAKKDAPSSESPSTMLSQPSADPKKDVTSISITLKSPTSSVEKPQLQSTFSFTSPSVKASTFGTPTTTAASTNLFTPPSQPSQTTVASTSAQTMSMFKPSATTVSSLFQKPNPTTTSTVTFQTTEATTTSAPPSAAAPSTIFSFGNNASNPAPAAEKPSFFSFGNNPPKTEAAPSLFKSPFGATTETNTNNNNSFALPAGNTLGTVSALPTSTLAGSNSLPSGNALSSGTLSVGTTVANNNPLGGSNGLPTNPLAGGNGLSAGPSGIFASAVQKENVWSSSAPSTNLFVSNTTASTNSLQKPATFTFGSSAPFNASSTTPAFGGSAQPAQNIFGMANQNNNNNNQPSMFSSPVQSQQPAPLFGTPQPPATNPAPQMGMFGSPSVAATPSFGGQNSSIPSFETPSLTSAPAPSFNFGGQQSAAIFGFGQQQQPPQAGVYNFGAAPAGGPQVQFTMGRGANTAGRRMRRAVRRNPR